MKQGITTMVEVKRRRAVGLGHPLYVNGRLFAEPVTISHVPGPVGNVDPSMGALGNYVAYAPQLGAEDLPGSSSASLPPASSTPAWAATLRSLYNYVAPVTGAAAIYHGYRRNSSVLWALWWGVMGAAFPVITIPIAIAQGFGDKRGMTPNRGISKRQRAARKGAKTRAAGGTRAWDVIRSSTNTTAGMMVAPAWKSRDDVQADAQKEYGDGVYVASRMKRNRRRRR